MLFDKTYVWYIYSFIQLYLFVRKGKIHIRFLASLNLLNIFFFTLIPTISFERHNDIFITACCLNFSFLYMQILTLSKINRKIRSVFRQLRSNGSNRKKWIVTGENTIKQSTINDSPFEPGLFGKSVLVFKSHRSDERCWIKCSLGN